MAFNLKRKRVFASRARNVRRKFGLRRTRRRWARTGGSNRRGIGFSSETAFGPYLGFKARRTSGRTWRRMLWRDTQAKSHYKSDGAFSDTQTTPVLASVSITRAVNAFPLDGGRFWSSTGGTVPLDTGTLVPTFEGDITLRGGKLGMTVFNTSATIPLKAKVYLIRDSQRPNLANLPATPPIGFDIREIAEFNDDIGRILYQKEFSLKPSSVGTVEYRLRPEKIDQLNWLAPVGSQYTWITQVTDYDGVAANVVRFTNYHNVSFSADVSNPGV